MIVQGDYELLDIMLNHLLNNAFGKYSLLKDDVRISI
jgi:hypothetical protein